MLARYRYSVLWKISHPPSEWGNGMAVDPCFANAHRVLGLSQQKMAEKPGVNPPRCTAGNPGSMNLPEALEHDRLFVSSFLRKFGFDEGAETSFRGLCALSEPPFGFMNQWVTV
jgi:hypothetical protein